LLQTLKTEVLKPYVSTVIVVIVR